LEEVFREHIGTGYFEARVLNQAIDESYLVENLVYGVFQIFAGMAIIIALLGLYGLVAFIANQRRKAISIRKVFGASNKVILRMFGQEYIILMLISFVLAIPLSYFLSKEWLNGFYYRIDISVYHYLLSFVAILLVTLTTIVAKSYRTATANPVDALRYE
jgi:ABC-type antimicrobial peptide transport system permease subunit